MNSTLETPRFMFVFANSDRTLPAIAKEREALFRIFTPLDQQGHISTEVLPDATPKEVIQAILGQRNNNLVNVIHFGGHATPTEIVLASDQSGSQHLLGAPMAKFLGLQRKLKLVFLNACSTEAFAQALIHAGVPTVVGTTKSVDDEVAAAFASAFYAALLLGGDTVVDAFHKAKLCTEAEYESKHPSLFVAGSARDMSGKPQLPEGTVPFQLFQNPSSPQGESWRAERMTVDSAEIAPPPSITQYQTNIAEGPGAFINIGTIGSITRNNYPS